MNSTLMKNAMDELNLLKQTLNENVSQIMGWDIDYHFCKESDQIIYGYYLTDIVKTVQMKILIPDESTEDLKSNPKPHVKILKSNFDTQPSTLDILYIKSINKMYTVSSISFPEFENYYDFNLSVYEKITTIRPNS